MELIPINITQDDLKRQFLFIKSYLDKKNWLRHKSIVTTYFIATSLYVMFYFFTSTDKYINSKAVFFGLLFIAWTFGLIYSIWVFIKRNKFNSSIYKYLIESPRSTKQILFSFDEEKITFAAAEIKTELAWTYYDYYLEDDLTIYLLSNKGHDASFASFASFSVSERGEANLM